MALRPFQPGGGGAFRGGVTTKEGMSSWGRVWGGREGFCAKIQKTFREGRSLGKGCFTNGGGRKKWNRGGNGEEELFTRCGKLAHREEEKPCNGLGGEACLRDKKGLLEKNRRVTQKKVNLVSQGKEH